ncbi:MULTISPECIES: hypothetical protein [unclassified Mesorhizobium]|uniref:hypothetical protein n=1 Tax=unclassified Mesorhizobium TaxID=325217 RepID=UPI000FDC5DE5|nr:MULTISPECIES: hypothetical protein [unclassified Mesorhizobium]TGT76205.1 hypothetical protein EN809_000845 [Mesorhizobium sp. M2E.F.Ca.ET.166.01.1.1]TGW02320.1 hypothetical protein EN797_000845 [Mesorhizobium sp. M2E.F.Ca.ET.154.01.1.1]
MTLTDEQTRILECAKLNRDRFLLPQRFRPCVPPSELDRQYETCHALVDGGYARWLKGLGAPGIELTGKPW